MKRHELEHVLRAASAITNHPDIVVIGSQALLAQFPDAPAELLVSMEADVRGLLKHHLADAKRIEALTRNLPTSEDVRERVRARLGRLTSLA